MLTKLGFKKHAITYGKLYNAAVKRIGQYSSKAEVLGQGLKTLEDFPLEEMKTAIPVGADEHLGARAITNIIQGLVPNAAKIHPEVHKHLQKNINNVIDAGLQVIPKMTHDAPNKEVVETIEKLLNTVSKNRYK
jgi:hypothetical protein